MDLADFGITVATMAATGGVEKAGADAVGLASGGVGKVRSKLREWFGGQDDADVLVEHLEAAEHSPVDLQIKVLAAALEEMASRDDPGAAEIAAIVEELSPGTFTTPSNKFNSVVKGNARNTSVTQGENVTVINE